MIYVAVCCSVLQCVVLQAVGVRVGACSWVMGDVLVAVVRVAIRYHTSQCVAVCGSVLQCVVTCFNSCS